MITSLQKNTRGGRRLTHNSSIFTVITVMGGDRLTVSKPCLSTNTVHIVINNCTGATAKSSGSSSNRSLKISRMSSLNFSTSVCMQTTKFKIIPVSEYPSCLQTTLASGVPQASSQTVPQLLFKHTSIRPSKLLLPPIRRTSLSVQAVTIR